MRVSAKADYALRALLVLADQAPAYVTVEALASAENMPRRFVELILSELRRAGLVSSRRGADGGHVLVVPADQISVGAVLRIVDGPQGEWPRQVPIGERPSAHLAEVWTAATVSLNAVLDRTTVQHLLTGRLPDHVRDLARSGEAADVAGS
jgi:Rrf2 family protein